jgi:hypothetical protein
MILGNAISTRYDWPLFLFLVALAAILLIGAVSAPGWSVLAASIVRRTAIGLAIVSTALLYIRYPTPDGMVGVARVVTIWAALAGDALFYGIWAWRAGRL